jgi:hypothetical protein
MKASCFVLFTLCLVSAPGFRAAAQTGVGVNTENPQGIFHVKAGGKDVVVKDGTGNVGIHTATPQAKVEIATPAPGNAALRIVDGQQADGLILTSDSAGNARWSNPVGTAGKLEAVLELGPQNISPNTYADVATSHFTVQADGYHVYEIRWYATYAQIPSRAVYIATLFQLIIRPAGSTRDSIADEFKMYRDITATAGDAVTFWMTLSAQAKTGDELSLTIRPERHPSISLGNLRLRKAGKLTTSKVIIKRLNVR